MTMNESADPAAVPRLLSLDAWRGLVMLLMMAEVMELSGLVHAYPGAEWARLLAFHTTHVEWIGCSLHDMIQPSFSFLVGAAMVFSFARRAREGPAAGLVFHAFRRGLVLVLLGVFLRSLDYDHTHWTLEDTLTQIGLGYPLLFLLGFGGPRLQWSALAVVLAGYWVFFAIKAVPQDFDYAAYDAGPASILQGFAAHWSKGSNPAADFDVWLFGKGSLLAWPEGFHHNAGGYCTLSFIPTLGTMILGLLAGRVLISPHTHGYKLAWLGIAAAAGIAAGLILDATGACPLVKRIWTPGWVLYSGGLCCAFLAAFYLIADVWEVRGPLFLLKVIGMNSIAAYMIAHLWQGFLGEALSRHFGWLGHRLMSYWPGAHEAHIVMMKGAAVLLVEWLILHWMYRRKVFLRV